jgi:hypothetical protein
MNRNNLRNTEALSSVTATTLTEDDVNWATDEHKGLILVPNTAKVNYNYRITGNTGDTLTVKGTIDTARVDQGNAFAIVYGKLVKDTIKLDDIFTYIGASTAIPDEYTLEEEDAGWADNEYKGLEVMPSTAAPSKRYTIDGNTSDTLTIQGPMDLDYVEAGDVFKIIMTKTGDGVVKFFREEGVNSFADGDGIYDGVCEICHTQTEHYQNNGEGTDQLHDNVGGELGVNCITCHPHTAGFAHGGEPGGGCGSSGSCHGTKDSHPTHVGGAGIQLSLDCSECHDTSNFPLFKDSQDLAGTTACNTCHSPVGSYNGVNSVNGSVGAKDNWETGVYKNSYNNLETDKEKWCAGCHDDVPSVIQGVSAPNVIGDEDLNTNYGIGYGFYKTGHGLPANRHDFTIKHIDGTARTYTYTASVGNDDDYQHGYRLKSIDGQLPLVLPRTGTCSDSGVNVAEFRLCLSCHQSEPFTDPNNYDTNFRRTGTPDLNAHYSHLSIKFACGYGPVFQSRASCISCHNVHGSEQLSMVRDGKLINREPALQVLYYKPGVSFDCFNYPDIRDVSLPESTGTIWNQNVGGICSTCHGSCGFDSVYYRSTPPWIMQVHGQVGSSTLTVNFSEGVYSNTGSIGPLVSTDLSLTDVDDGRMIIDVTHNAGEASATMTVNPPLDDTNDIDTDTLAAATITSIYDAADTPMDTTPVTITGAAAGATGPPGISDQTPANGTGDVDSYSNLTFTLSDSGSGVDWTTFEIQLSGDKGYSKLYTDADFLIVSKTGSPVSYDVIVNPDVDLGYEEIITVTVRVDDYNGNSLVPPAWSFTTASEPVEQTLILHPSGVVSNGGFLITGGTWADVLDTNDGDAGYVYFCCSSPGQTFYVDMDDSGLGGGVYIQDLTVYVYARYVNPGGSPTPVPGNVDIGYKTGTTTEWKGSTATDASGDYNLIQSVTYTSDSDGDPLDLADINNIQLAVKRNSSGPPQLRVTEVYVEVTYLP